MTDKRAQTFVPIEEVRDGIAILKDGGLRAILMASSVNISLKSSEEREAILRQFQSFLNTLDFSLQLYVQSRELDINPYLELLAAREPNQSNDLMKIQLREYMGFIKEFTHKNDIMTKNFFIVVPYSPAKIDVKKGIRNLFGNSFAQKKTSLPEDAFEEHRSQLEQRIAVVEHGLHPLGVRTAYLETSKVVDLFYHIFNPHEGKKALPPHS